MKLDINSLPAGLKGMKGLYCISTDYFMQQGLYKIGMSYTSLYSRMHDFGLHYPSMKIYLFCVLTFPKQCDSRSELLKGERISREPFTKFSYAYRNEKQTEWVYCPDSLEVFSGKIKSAFENVHQTLTKGLGTLFFDFSQDFVENKIYDKNIEKIVEEKGEKYKLYFVGEPGKPVWGR